MAGESLTCCIKGLPLGPKLLCLDCWGDWAFAGFQSLRLRMTPTLAQNSTLTICLRRTLSMKRFVHSRLASLLRRSLQKRVRHWSLGLLWWPRILPPAASMQSILVLQTRSTALFSAVWLFCRAKKDIEVLNIGWGKKTGSLCG